MNYEIIQCEKNFNKYTIKQENSEKFVFFKGGKKRLKKEIENIGVEDFINKYEIESLEGKKTKKKNRSSEFDKEIERLEESKTELCIRLMNMKLVKGSPEHLELKKQFHDAHEQLIAIPGYETWEQQMSHFTKEELHDLRRLGEQKKEEKKEKKERKGKVKNL